MWGLNIDEEHYRVNEGWFAKGERRSIKKGKRDICWFRVIGERPLQQDCRIFDSCRTGTGDDTLSVGKIGNIATLDGITSYRTSYSLHVLNEYFRRKI